MHKITAIKDLIHQLILGPGYEGYSELVKSIDLDKEEYLKFCSWNDESYTRNCLYSIPSFEAVIMCWKPGQLSPWHTYGHEQGWVRIIEGRLTREIANIESDKLVIRDKVILENGSTAYVSDSMGFHRYVNDSDSNVISLHIFASRIDEWDIYDEETRKVGTSKPGFDSGQENYFED